MPFSKTFPKEVEGQSFPKWVEVSLTEEQEKALGEDARKENIKIMQECIKDAQGIMEKGALKDFQTDMVRVAIALFEKRASHEVYWKENKAKEIFDTLNKPSISRK